MVAALFALHPLHVESVAWVSERKDVLSTFFGLAALWAYVLYGQNPRRLAYGATLILFALALMAKPMLVTLPLLMMLFDFWPLARVRVMLDEGRSWARSVPRLLYEKIPFFGLSAGCAALAWIAQSRGGAMRDWEVFPLTVRIAGACTSYLLYLVKTAYPIHLAVFYPHQGADIPVGLTVLSGTVLISATLWAFWGYRTRPHILMGWLWYLVSLLPVIGLVQVGGQAMADRYTYIPLIGIFIAIVWEIRRLKIPRLPRAVCLPSIAALLLVVLALLTYRQVGYWRDSEALFLRALDVIQDNLVAHKNLAQFYLVNEELDRAEHHSREALRLSPESAIARVNLGVVFGRRNQVDEALRLFREAYARDPHDPDVLYNLALGEFMARHFEEALVPVEELVSLRPHDQEAWQILAESVGNWKGVDEIVPHVESLFQQSPAPLDAMAAFGHVSLRLGNTQAARAQFERVLDEAPSHAVALKGLQRLN
jgi:hypothetical protein